MLASGRKRWDHTGTVWLESLLVFISPEHFFFLLFLAEEGKFSFLGNLVWLGHYRLCNPNLTLFIYFCFFLHMNSWCGRSDVIYVRFFNMDCPLR